MNLITYRPYDYSSSIFESMDKFLSKAFDNILYTDEESLLTDVYEDEKEYRLRMDMPGVKRKCIDISIEDNAMKISAERKDIENNKRYNTIGASFYNRRFHLPEDVNVDKIEGKFKNGCLLLIIPKVKSIKKDIKKVPIS